MSKPDTSFLQSASVVLDLGLDATWDYGIPQELLGTIVPGSRVEVPVRAKKLSGYVVKVATPTDHRSLRPILRSLDEGSPLPQDLLDLALWMRRYYGANLSQIFRILLPAPVRRDVQHKEQLYVMRRRPRDELAALSATLRLQYPAQADVLDVMLRVTKGILLSELLEATGTSKSPVDTLVKKGLLALDIVRIDRSPLIDEEYFQTQPKVLNQEQSLALSRIQKSLDTSSFQTHLLYGITGSGKTEVYLQAIQHALSLGKSSLMLVPEISLTPQTIERFRSRFKEKIAILHHRLSPGERYDEWFRIRRGECSIVIGARSAIFSPVQNLGLIIVDEEHESSYKQTEEAPCYHARDVAVMRGHLTHSAVLLGSATPSLESYHNALRGKYQLCTLSQRAQEALLPSIHLVDMQKEYEKAKGFTLFSDRLLTALKTCTEGGQQAILFLNRRGYHSSLVCQQCQQAVFCSHCAVAMTFHYQSHKLSCHLCGFSLSPPPKECPSCRAVDTMKFRGVGTEQVERALHAIFPQVRTLRMDADTTRHKGSHETLLREFKTGKADVLIGTQMIAKGLHFPNVSLVGILNGDAGLQIPDFRAAEYAFQLMTQVAGRAGRGKMQGEVFLQSAMPEHPTLQLARQQDFVAFAKEELAHRKAFAYPPFCHLIKIALTGDEENITFQVSSALWGRLRSKLPLEYEMLPVLPSGYAKVKNRYRYQFLVKGISIYHFHNYLRQALADFKLPKTMRLLVDVDPISTYF